MRLVLNPPAYGARKSPNGARSGFHNNGLSLKDESLSQSDTVPSPGASRLSDKAIMKGAPVSSSQESSGVDTSLPINGRLPSLEQIRGMEIPQELVSPLTDRDNPVKGILDRAALAYSSRRPTESQSQR